MIVICPQCSKRYQLDAHLLHGHGRRVRCAMCGHVWHQKPDPVVSMADNPAIRGMKNVTVNDSQKPSRVGAYLGWGSLGLVLMAMIGFLLMGSSFVTYHVPQTQRIYEMLGWVNEPGYGLSITNTKIEAAEDGQFIVEGDVINSSDKPRPVGGVRVKVIGNVGCENPVEDGSCVMKEWSLPIEDDSLLPGEQVHFKSKPQPILKGTKRVIVGF